MELDPQELRSAAAALREPTQSLIGYDFPDENVTDTSFGHIELTSWFRSVVQQCDQSGEALGTGAESLAARLIQTATDFENTDKHVADAWWVPATEPVFGTGWQDSLHLNDRLGGTGEGTP